MNTEISCRFLTALGILLLVITSAGSPNASAQTRVGVFDSRAVALARVRSADFENPVTELMDQMNAAKEEGNDAEILRLKKLGSLHQAHLHDLVFGRGTVNDFFAELQPRLAAIAEAESLDIIVSKWETAFLGPRVTVVDITEKLVEQYHPDDAVRKMIDEMKKVEPVKDALFLED